MVDIDTRSQQIENVSLEQFEPGFCETGDRQLMDLNRLADRCDDVWVEVFDDLTQLDRYKTQWQSLAENALSANGSVEYFIVCGVVRHLVSDLVDVKSVLVWEGVHSSSRKQLIGLFFVQKQQFRWGWPARFASSWRHIFSFLGTPLVHQEHSQAAIGGFIKWATEDARLGSFLFGQIPTNSRFFSALEVCLGRQQNSYRLFDPYERAVLYPQTGAQDYLQAALTRKRRKEYRRLRTRLGELGALESIFTDKAGTIDVWTEEFLTLEANGWKGRQGSAYLCQEDRAHYLRTLLCETFAKGRGLFWKITLDGKPIAMSFGLTGLDGQAWLAKIAYDENFARFSPGVLLVLDITEMIAGRKDIKWMDSCAAPNHPMINNIWRERLPMADVLVSLSGNEKSPRFKFIYFAEAMRRKARVMLKRIYHQIRKGKYS